MSKIRFSRKCSFFPRSFIYFLILFLTTGFLFNLTDRDFRTPFSPAEVDAAAPENEVRVHFIDVGQGDSILIKAYQEGTRRKMLVDAGQRWKGRDNVVPYLNELGIDTIHVAVGTHPHADHIGGLIEVFGSFTVQKVLDPGLEHDTQTYADYMNSIEEHDIELVEARSSMKVKLGEDIKFKVLNPAEPLRGDPHGDNITGRLRHEETALMLTGDMEAEVERKLLEGESGGSLEADILKVGHHGSATSTTPEFLRAVDPEAAVIQVGKDNRYGHPDDEVLSRLLEAGLNIYRNDLQGTVVAVSDGRSFTFKEAPLDTGEIADDKDANDAEKTEVDAEDVDDERININVAGFEELQEITGVGGAIAENIIDYRENLGPFTAIEDIMNVDGIAEGRFAEMEDEIKVEEGE